MAETTGTVSPLHSPLLYVRTKRATPVLDIDKTTVVGNVRAGQILAVRRLASEFETASPAGEESSLTFGLASGDGGVKGVLKAGASDFVVFLHAGENEKTRDSGGKTGAYEDRPMIHSGLRHNGWIHKDNVRHRKEGSRSSKHLPSKSGAIFLQPEKFRNRLLHIKAPFG